MTLKGLISRAVPWRHAADAASAADSAPGAGGGPPAPTLGLDAESGAPVELEPGHRGLLVVGRNGCGKTLLTERLFYRLALRGAGRSLVFSPEDQRYEPIALAAGGLYVGSGGASPSSRDPKAARRADHCVVAVPDADCVGFWREILEGLSSHDPEPYRLFFDPLEAWLSHDPSAQTLARLWEDRPDVYPVGTLQDPSVLLTPAGRRVANAAGAALVMRHHRRAIADAAKAFGPFGRAALAGLDADVGRLRTGEAFLFAAGHPPTRLFVDATDEEFCLFNTDPRRESGGVDS